MKSLILSIALILAVAVGVNAQDYSGRIKGPTTLTNAQNDTVEVTIPLSRSAITFKYDVSRTSGTLAGTITLQGKVSTVAGEQWITLNTDTLTNSATYTSAVPFVANNYLQYRVITAMTGTQVSVHNKFLLYRKY